MPQKHSDATRRVDVIERGSAPRIVTYGEDLRLEHLPVGTRVVYPNPPIEGIANVEAAIRYALNHPDGSEPFYALLKPGMSVTIAIDDISLPLPPMRAPDVRQRILEIVLEQLGQHGVEDIEIIIATSFHRRQTADETRHMVGKRIFDAYWPKRLYNHDAEKPDGMVTLGHTKHGEAATLNRRAAESDLLVYVNINLVPMDGGHKSIGVGLCGYETLRAHHNPEVMLKTNSYMDPKHSEMHRSCDRIGRLVEKNLKKVFKIETVLNTRMFGDQLDFMTKREDEWTRADRAKFDAMSWAIGKMPRAAKRKVLFNVPAEYDVIGVYAGATEPVHARTLERCYEQYVVPLKGQADVMITGVPFVGPYNVNSIMNPLLVQCMSLGYFYNMYVGGTPLIRNGGVMIVCHPLIDEWSSEHHPSYIEFFFRLLTETRDSFQLRDRWEEKFAKNPNYIAMYRNGHAYHGAHPFYMWYWGDAGRKACGKVIACGAESKRMAQILGWDVAKDLTEAYDMAKSFLNKREPETLFMHHPPIVIGQVTP